ncbi:glycosyltransferase family 2 protein [Leptolyngbya sp. NIES-2104]|uniref:glycosyltransferase family 2 protein n=1 Tax=Leptolyngbya sp. NIES-2104 TaxID=1552121 RepID=UPI0006ECA78C|nr:glycosyltransferase family A protein [Leptolyngbya sp. NIES-2104]GAP97001.1 glycosyltransferase PglI [Leptolyngbya sp. NIES-2104]
MNPLVSIIINNYNYADYLGAAIESALSQSYSNIEVIVVDDGSTDSSRAIIAHYGDRILPILKSNGGQASAFNAGFAASRGEFICFLDSDDVLIRDRVSIELQALINSPDAGWSYHQLSFIDKAGLPLAQSPEPLPEAIYRFDFRQEMQQGTLNHIPLPLPGTDGYLYRRSHLQQILPMPEGEGVSLNDSYLQYASFALSKGIALTAQLHQQRIHGNNSFTLRRDRAKVKLRAKIHLLSAYWLRANFPEIHRYTDKLFSVGLGLSWKTGGIAPNYQELPEKYCTSLPLLDRIKIYTRAIYYFLKP